jgi:hypothetical protein
VKVLLDSVILIDHFNGIAEATRYLSDTQGEAAISVITRAKVLTGFDAPAALRKATRLLDTFPALAIDQAAADLAAALRRRHGWKLPDAFQAALAQQYGLQLATRNVRDFLPRRHGFVVVPYSL